MFLRTRFLLVGLSEAQSEQEESAGAKSLEDVAASWGIFGRIGRRF